MPTRRERAEILVARPVRVAAGRAGSRHPPPAGPGSRPSGRSRPVKPARLKAGDTVGLVMPSFAQWDPVPLDILLDTLKALGLEARLGKHVLDRRGYFAGRDEDRAADLNAMFADPEVDAIHCVRGGWGAARLLPLLDWDTIAADTPRSSSATATSRRCCWRSTPGPVL